ncbi:hypothetical protein HYW32_02420 [Candidatus Berkelbacteria bacterium]|nr:hypothetical protein [Candidatus Berkelbacteria bacterium]
MADHFTTNPLDPAALFEENIFVLLGLNDLPEEKKAALREQMLSSVRDRALVRIYDLLPKEEQQKFNEALEKEDQETIQQLLSRNKLDLSKLMVEEAILYKLRLTQASEQLEDAAHAEKSAT